MIAAAYHDASPESPVIAVITTTAWAPSSRCQTHSVSDAAAELSLTFRAFDSNRSPESQPASAGKALIKPARDPTVINVTAASRARIHPPDGDTRQGVGLE